MISEVLGTLTPFDWGILAIAAFLAGLVRGFTGFGSALVFMPLAGSVLPPVQAIVTGIVIDLIGTSVVVPGALKDARRTDLKRLFLGLLVGVPLGLMILGRISPDVFRYTVSLAALAMLAVLITGFRFKSPPGPKGTVAIGGLGGLLGASAGLPGPPVILAYVAGPHGPAVIRANTMIYLYGFDIYAIAAIFLTAAAPPGALLLGVVFSLPNMMGNLTGARLVNPNHEKTYRVVAYVIIGASALLSLPLLG